MPSPIRKKIVVIAPNWLGDAVMSLPLAGYLSAVPDVSVCVFANEYVAPIYRGADGIGELVVFARNGRMRGVAAKTAALKALGASAAVILPPSFSSALAPFAAGVRVRVGYKADGRGMLLTDKPEPNRARDVHLSDEYIGLGRIGLAGLGIEPPVEYRVPSVRVPEGADGPGVVFKGGRRPERYAVLVPGATYGPAKSWPCERYKQLAGELADEIPVVLAGGPGEREACEIITGGGENIFNACGQTNLEEFISLLAGASVVIANDSGAPHVAASLGVPAVVLFGSTSPAWTAPLGDRVYVVRVPYPCAPCFRKTCPTDLECFKGIEPEAVLERTREALAASLVES